MAARVILYRTYRWIDKDPVIDAVKTVVQSEKLKNSEAHAISGVASATLDGWFTGPVRKPQNATVTALTSALGWVRHDKLNRDGTVEVSFEKVRDLDWQKEIEKQADFLLNAGRKKKQRQRKKKNGAH